MKTMYSSSQIIGCFTRENKEYEVCATSEGQFDEERSELLMELDSFVRPVDLVAKEEHLRVGWLPKKERLKESVSLEEAPDMAREIFHRWVHNIQHLMPSTAYS